MSRKARTDALKKARAGKRERNRPPRFRILPITMMMAFLLLGVKVNSIYTNGQAIIEIQTAYAQDADAPKDETSADAKPADEAEATATETDEVAADAETTETTSGETTSGESTEVASVTPEAPIDDSPKPSREQQQSFSAIELEILQKLSGRREELEKRAQEMDLKEKLLEATELRVNDKLDEIKQLKVEVDAVLVQYNEMEDKKIGGLVKIYEAMKPKDAAQIFNELDMGILLDVVDRMSERKVAPVLAGMDPVRARELTEELAEYRKLQMLPKTVGEAEPAATPQ